MELENCLDVDKSSNDNDDTQQGVAYCHYSFHN